MTIKKVYADISKTEELDDGTVKVWGYASSEEEDSDGEVIKADAMKAALPDYMKWANVREMHQPKAAGTAIEAEVQEDGRTWFGAHVIDTEAVKKVKARVYKGFSIGGKVTGRDELNKTIITGIKLVEVSLVDRPANPEAVFTVVKAESLEGEDAVNQLAELLNKGEVSPQELLELVMASKAAKTESATETDLKKAGNRYSKTTKAALADIHKCVTDAHEKLAAMGYDKEEEKEEEEADDSESKKSELAQSVLKANTGEGSGKSELDELAKVNAAHAELLKAVGAAGCPEGGIAADFVKALATKRDELEKRVKELESQPEHGKARLINVSKTEDNGGTDAVKADAVIGFDGQQNDVATLIKFVHQHGGIA